jgi:alanine-glyoxylate transaminase/serine-glyoxylate transaminase/serine-pyruvate transaminase
MTYALHEALTMVLEEGLDARIERHAQMYRRLRTGLEAMGLSYIPKHSLHSLNCIGIPAGADDAKVRRRLLEDDGIEIALHEGFWVMHGNCFYLPGQQGEGRSDFAGDLFTFLVIR